MICSFLPLVLMYLAILKKESAVLALDLPVSNKFGPPNRAR